MSNDPRINSALFNFCIAADDGPRQPVESIQRSTPEDLRWLRDVMSSVEMPDRAVKRCVTKIADWFVPLKDTLPIDYSGASSTGASSAAASNNGQPVLMLPAPPPGAPRHPEQQESSSSSSSSAPQQQQQQAPARPVRPVLLSDLPASIPDDVLDCAEELCDLIEDLNYAKEFMLLGGVRVFLDVLRVSFQAANNTNEVTTFSSSQKQRKAAAVDEKEQQTAKAWSEFRSILLRSLGAASANFDVVQNDMCKYGWAKLLVPQLTFSVRQNLVGVRNADSSSSSSSSPHQPLKYTFPSEVAAHLLCVTNVMRQHAPALELFLQSDGMFHVANAVEMIRFVTEEQGASSSQQQQQQDDDDDAFSGFHFSCESIEAARNEAAKKNKTQQQSPQAFFSERSAWLTAKRRAFNAARYLVEEHGVTSQRVLRAAVDLVRKTSLEMMSRRPPAASEAAAMDGRSAAATVYDEDDFARDTENACFAASVAAKVISYSLERVMKNENSKNETDVDKLMPLWGKYLLEKLGGSWWDKVKPFSKMVEGAEGGADDAALLLVQHHDLSDALIEMTKRFVSLRGKVPAFAGFESE